MKLPSAILLGIFGALLCSVTLAHAHWISVAHITPKEKIEAGVVAAIGAAMMIAAFLAARSAVVIVLEIMCLGLVYVVYSLMLTSTGRSPSKTSMARLREIATAVEARATDVNEYPSTRNLDQLAPLIEPTYSKHMPREDGYRNTIRYESWKVDPKSPGNDTYAVGSAGKDWIWEKRSLRDYLPRITHSFDCDIVFSNGTFVSYPEGIMDGSAETKPEPPPPPPLQQQQETTTDPKAIFDQATSLYRADKFTEAVPLFEQYLKANPNDALANARIGICLGQLNRLQESIPYLLKAAALDPTDYQSRSNLGLVYEKLGRAEEGVEWERQADKIKPNDPAVLHNLGWVLERAGHQKEAAEAYDREKRARKRPE